MLKSPQQLIIDTSQETKAKAEDIHVATWQHFHISRHEQPFHVPIFFLIWKDSQLYAFKICYPTNAPTIIPPTVQNKLIKRKQ